MLIIVDLGFSNPVLVVSLVFPAIFLLVRRKWRQSAARKEEIKRLLLLASEEVARAELEYSLNHRATLEYSLKDTTVSTTSPSPSHQCAVCDNPSTGQCALCKAVRYCSGKCQIVHWRQGHKEECHPPAEGTVLCQEVVNERNRSHSGGNKRSNLVERLSYESPFLNSSVSTTELHARCDNAKVELHAINDSESSNASFSGFSSSPDNSESPDDNSLYGSSSSAESGKSNNTRVAHEIFGDDCDTDIPDQPKSVSSKSGGSVDSLKGFTNLSKSKTTNGGYNDGQVEFRSVTASRTDDKVMPGGSSTKQSPSLTGYRESAHGPNKSSNLVDVSCSRATPVSSGTCKIDLSNRESSLSFSFNSSRNPNPLFSQDSEKEVYDVLTPKKPQHGCALVDSSKYSVPSVKCESSVCLDDKVTNKTSISKPVLGSLSCVSSQANVSSEIEASTARVESYQTVTSSDHAVNDVDSKKLHKECPPISTCASDIRASCTSEVRSTSHVKSGKAERSHMHGETAFQSAAPLSNPRNGLKTSMWRAIDQLKGSMLSKHSQVGDANAIDRKCKEMGLITAEFFIQLYTSKGVELHPRGLLNCGNSCYANAVLQCLAFTPPLTSYFLQKLHSKTCIKRDWCFTCELENLILKMREGKSPVSPIGIVSKLKSIGSQLANGRQEDAHEFLRYAIDKMQSVCILESGTKTISAVEEERTVIGRTFGGHFRSKIQCSRCHGKLERQERMMDLTVEIEGDIGTLEEALRQFTRTETLDGVNKYRCSRCKSYEKAKKKLTVLQAPNILTIALKRFQAGKFGKLNKAVQFPETLDLASFMSRTADKPKYFLYGVIVHLDVMNAAFSGHYICYVKDSWGKWFKIDDSTVTPVELKRLLNKEAYMLFYARDLSRDSRSAIKNKLAPPDPDNAAHLRSRETSSRSNSNSSSSRVQSGNCYRTWRGSRSYPELDRIREDTSSDNSSLFSSSNSDEGSSSSSSSLCSSSASTRDSFTSFDDLSDYIFGHSPCETSWCATTGESRR